MKEIYTRMIEKEKLIIMEIKMTISHETRKNNIDEEYCLMLKNEKVRVDI